MMSSINSGAQSIRAQPRSLGLSFSVMFERWYRWCNCISASVGGLGAVIAFSQLSVDSLSIRATSTTSKAIGVSAFVQLPLLVTDFAGCFHPQLLDCVAGDRCESNASRLVTPHWRSVRQTVRRIIPRGIWVREGSATAS